MTLSSGGCIVRLHKMQQLQLRGGRFVFASFVFVCQPRLDRGSRVLFFSFVKRKPLDSRVRGNDRCEAFSYQCLGCALNRLSDV